MGLGLQQSQWTEWSWSSLGQLWWWCMAVGGSSRCRPLQRCPHLVLGAMFLRILPLDLQDMLQHSFACRLVKQWGQGLEGLKRRVDKYLLRTGLQEAKNNKNIC